MSVFLLLLGTLIGYLIGYFGRLPQPARKTEGGVIEPEQVGPYRTNQAPVDSRPVVPDEASAKLNKLLSLKGPFRLPEKDGLCDGLYLTGTEGDVRLVFGYGYRAIESKAKTVSDAVDSAFSVVSEIVDKEAKEAARKRATVHAVIGE